MKLKVGTAGLFSIALLAAAVLPPTASGSVVIGSSLANPPNANGTCGSPSCTILQTVSSSPLKSPVNGTVVSWKTFGGSANIGTYGSLRLRIIRDAGGGNYTAVRSGPATSIPTSAGNPVITTPVNPGLPVSQNDLIGVDELDGSTSLAGRVVGGFSYALWDPPLADGTTRPLDVGGTREYLYQATIEPTNTFVRSGVTRNKKKGTATVKLTLPNAGQLTGSAKDAKVASAAGATISKVVAAGPARLQIKAKGKKKEQLNETGKVKITVKITYTPTGGTAHTQSTKVKLKKT